MSAYTAITRDLGLKAASDCVLALTRTTQLCADTNQQFHVTLHAVTGVLGAALGQFRALGAAEGLDFPPRMIAETLVDKMLRPMVVAVATGEPSDKAADAILAGLAEPDTDTWVEISTLGEPNRSTWPWNGDPVLIHCRSIIPKEPGVTGQGRFTHRPGLGWDWWLIDTDSQRDPPVRGICGPVTHVRRIVPPVEG